MEAAHHVVATYADQTLVDPIGLAALVVLSALIVALPRRWATLPILLLACLIPWAHRIVVATIDFSFLRILLMVGWVRVLARGENRRFAFGRVDQLFVAWVVVGALVYAIRAHTVSALVFVSGESFDALALYFFCRLTIRSLGDVARLAEGTLLVALPTALFFLIEHATGRNLFSVLGGVSAVTAVRDGRLRCQGAFQHPILAGIFWVCLAPLIGARWWDRRAHRALVVLGLGAVLAIVWTTASSTPILGLLTVIGAAFLYPLRFELRWLRRGLVVLLLALQSVMDHPVWHLIARLNVVGGSTGWHRYHLIDQFVKRFGEWWLLGLNSTVQWGWWLQDTTNAYVMQGVHGGIWTLALFVALIAACFREVGHTLRAVEGHRTRSAYVWALGLGLFGHCVVMIAASYFGQILIAWYMTCGVAGCLPLIRARARAEVDELDFDLDFDFDDELDAEEGEPAGAGAPLARLLRFRT